MHVSLHSKKIISMKRILALSFISLLIFAASCGSNPKDELIGTWKVDKVNTDFDESKVTPEMLSQIVEMQKETFFKFTNDSIMVIVSNNNTNHEAFWQLDDDGTISFFFKGNELKANKLGKIENNYIISTSKSPLGTITIWYVKE